ncbi:Lymphokine-activated killer T-cell-originated protein kinase [Vulpes lagopus]
MEEINNFKTPSKLSEKKKSALCSTPCINIPASPFMQKLGFGTGVNVYLMKRSPRDDDDDEDKTFDESDFDDEAYYAALGTRPPVNMEELDETYQKVIELFSVCTNEDPKDRPSAAHIVEALEIDVQ